MNTHFRHFLLLGFAIMIQITINAQDFSRVMDGYYTYQRFWGNVLIVQKGKVLYEGCYGFADKEQQERNNPQTIFNLASVSKTITAAAILKLQDQGKLNLNERVDSFFPNFMEDDTRDIKILNLLNHTSGMSANIFQSDDQGNGLVLPDKNVVSKDSLLSRFKHSKLKFKPGTRFEYNNFGYTLLAYIIEKVSGMTYPDYIEKEIFNPSGMKNSFFRWNYARKTSIGYNGIGSQVTHPESFDEYHPSWLLGAGGIYSTTSDLVKFMQGVFSARLFSEKCRNLMLDTCVDSSFPATQWTLGWAKQKIDNEDFYTHGGSVNGYSTKIIYVPGRDLSIVILSNLVRDLQNESIKGIKFSFVDNLAEDLLKLVYKKEVTPLPLPFGFKDKTILGSYKVNQTLTARVFVKNDSLWLSMGQLSLFNCQINSEIRDLSKSMTITQNFSRQLLAGNFDGFENYVSQDLKTHLFNQQSIGNLVGSWKNLTSESGKYLSYTVYKVRSEGKAKNYSIAFHFEKSDVLMNLSYGDDGLMQGLFIVNILPRCRVSSVALIPTGKNQFFVDGYGQGGYKDYYITFDRLNRKLYFKAEGEKFWAERE